MISVELSQLSVLQEYFAPCWSCSSPSNAGLKLPRETSVCFDDLMGLMKWCYCCVYLVCLMIQTALPWVDLQSQLPMYWHHVAGGRHEGSKYQVFLHVNNPGGQKNRGGKEWFVIFILAA